MEHHHPILGTLGGQGYQVKRYIYNIYPHLDEGPNLIYQYHFMVRTPVLICNFKSLGGGLEGGDNRVHGSFVSTITYRKLYSQATR